MRSLLARVERPVRQTVMLAISCFPAQSDDLNCWPVHRVLPGTLDVFPRAHLARPNVTR
jgi:hypothetical protein